MAVGRPPARPALRGRSTVTQLHYARLGEITPEMEYVARREKLDPEIAGVEVARGRMVFIPANKNHLNLEPMGIGIAALPIARSTRTSAWQPDHERRRGGAREAALKLDQVRRRHRDGPVDRRGDIDGIRRASIRRSSTVPIGTVPIYQVLEKAICEGTTKM